MLRLRGGSDRTGGSDTQAAQQAAAWKRELLARALQRPNDAGLGEAQMAWLRDLELREAPRILAELAASKALRKPFPGSPATAAAVVTTFAGVAAEAVAAAKCPEVYQGVLRLLRAAWASGRWPETSPARARLLRGGDGGTFSVGQLPEGQPAPKGNLAFPELTAAIFALERAIAPPGRPRSTTAAVTHNVAFAPHRDGGAGAGQSTSLIVGLGDYAGGELVVEGVASDIRC